MNKVAILILALVSVLSAQGEASAKKKVVEPVIADTLTLLIQAGDSLMQQYNTFEALRFYQQAFAMKDTLESRTKLADCYYKRANYRQTADLLKNVPAGDLTHESFRQLCYSYQKQGDNDSYIYWTSNLLSRYPMDGEMMAGLIVAVVREDQAWKGIGYGEDYFKKDSTNILVNRALADAYFMDRQFDKSVMMYERLLQQGDSTFNTLYSAGMCYSRLDSLELAYLPPQRHATCRLRLPPRGGLRRYRTPRRGSRLSGSRHATPAARHHNDEGHHLVTRRGLLLDAPVRQGRGGLEEAFGI